MQTVNEFVSYIILALILSAIIFLFFYLRKTQKKEEISKSLNMSLLLVTVPLQKKEGREREETERLISIMEQFYSNIADFENPDSIKNKKAPYISAFEISIHIKGEDAHFYIAVPNKSVENMEKKITAIIGDARVELVEDYNIFNPKGVSKGGYITMEKSFFLPVKTYKDLESDPLNSILNAMSQLQFNGEGAAIQILLKPNKTWQKTIQKIITEMKKGRTFSQAYSESTKGLIGNLIDVVFKKQTQNKNEQNNLDDLKIKALEDKASKRGFDVNVRIVTSAYTETRASAILADIESAFLQFENPGINSFKIKKLSGKKLQKMLYNFSFRNFNKANRLILNTEELSSIFHFPTPYLETKKVKALKSKTAPAPSNLPSEGLLIGKNVYRGTETEIKIASEDRLRHLYIIGQTGTGKSVSLKNMIQQDIENGEGVCFIDPHGEDLEDIMTRIPKERKDDVILFDPSDLQRPLGINMLEFDENKPEQKTFIIDEMVTIFDKLYDLKTSGGPMFEQYLRNALLLLMSTKKGGSTLLEVPRIFSDTEFRKMKLSETKDVLVKNFWEVEATKAGGQASLANITPYITSKFNVFLANEFVRPIISQQKSTINFRDIMDNKKILLVNLSKGKIGDINSSLLGLIIVGKLTMSALSRGDIAKEDRNPFYLYIDEFHNFATDSISVILSEARKYKLSLTVAHQFIAQLPENIRDAIFGNVGSMMSFRIGTEDAEFMEKQFAPEFNANDLMNLDNLNSYAKLLINNQASKAFSLKIDFPKDGSAEIAKIIKESSRIKYGKAKHEIDLEIEERYKKEEKNTLNKS